MLHRPQRADDKKGCTPPPLNVYKKGDTAFRRRRGFLCACGRWRQSNCPAGCVRFHGTLFFIYSPSLHQNSQTPNALWYKHSPLRKAKRIAVRVTSLVCAPRACVSPKKSLIEFRACWTEEEEYRVIVLWLRTNCSDELICENNNNSCYSSSSAENAASYALCTMSCIYCCILVLLFLSIPITKYQILRAGIIRTM